MRKLFKKSLACCLVLALSLCMFAGAISANAEMTTNPAYSTEDVTVAPGESTTIKFTIKDFAEIQGVILKVYVPSVVSKINSVEVAGVDLVEWKDETGEGNYQIGSDETGKFVKFMSLANFEEVDNDDIAILTFDINVIVDAEAEAKSYDYPAPVIQATDGNQLVTINGEFGKFTVEVKEPEVPAEPDPDEVEEVELKIRHTVAFESKAEINFKVATNLLAGCTDVYAEFSYVTFDGTALVPDTLIVPAEIWGSDYVFTYDRCPMAEIGCDVVYATKADGSKIKSQVDVYSVKTYAYNQFTKTNVNPELLTLLVDLLRYASACQVNSNVLTDALVDADLTPAMAAYGTDTSIPVTADAAPADKAVVDNAQVTFNKSLIPAETTYIRFYMTTTLAKEDMVLNISYTNLAGELKEFAINGADFLKETSGKKRYYYDFGEIAPADMRAECDVYVSVDGVAVSNTIVYGIESYCSSRVPADKTGALNDMLRAMLRFSDAANVYFS